MISVPAATAVRVAAAAMLTLASIIAAALVSLARRSLVLPGRTQGPHNQKRDQPQTDKHPKDNFEDTCHLWTVFSHD